MVIYLPVKFEFDWTQCFQVRVRKQKFWQTNGQKTDKRTDLKMYFLWFSRGHSGWVVTHTPPTSMVRGSNPRSFVGKGIFSPMVCSLQERILTKSILLTDRQTDKKQTMNRPNYTNIERNLAMSGNKNVDGQTDVRHINLIGGLVTHNSPKNVFSLILQGPQWQSGVTLASHLWGQGFKPPTFCGKR